MQHREREKEKVTMQTGEHPQLQQQLMVQNSSGSLSFNSNLSKEDEEMSRSALSNFRAKEEEIERKKMEVREKVQAQLGRVEEETKRLATIREVCHYVSQIKLFTCIKIQSWGNKNQFFFLVYGVRK